MPTKYQAHNKQSQILQNTFQRKIKEYFWKSHKYVKYFDDLVETPTI